MKLIVAAVLAFVAAAHAASLEVTPRADDVSIVKSSFKHNPDGGYEFGYETGDGSSRYEVGEVKEVEGEDQKPHKVVLVRGEYSYPQKDGTREVINYVANENGYQADGPSVPKVPAVSRR